MTPQEFAKLIEKKAFEIMQLQKRTLPIIVGSTAKVHFKQNFKEGGFVNNGVHKWKDKKVPNGYGILHSKRDHLFSSIQSVPGDGEVRIINEVPYAEVHNTGGIQYVRPHKRTSKKGNRYNVRDHSYRMPKRQFIGESAELNEKVQNIIETELTKILNS